MNKTTIKKYIQEINKSKKKVFRCEDLSKATGEKVEKIKENLSYYNPLINFDDNFNIKDIKDDLQNELDELSKEPLKKKEAIKKNEVDKYSSLLDYVYKNMTIAGGMLEVGYPLSKKDILILKKLLKKEEDKLKQVKK